MFSIPIAFFEAWQALKNYITIFLEHGFLKKVTFLNIRIVERGGSSAFFTHVCSILLVDR
jgi:hypothetical protein